MLLKNCGKVNFASQGTFNAEIPSLMDMKQRPSVLLTLASKILVLFTHNMIASLMLMKHSVNVQSTPICSITISKISHLITTNWAVLISFMTMTLKAQQRGSEDPFHLITEEQRRPLVMFMANNEDAQG